MSRTICDFHKVMQFEELSKLTAEQLAEEDSDDEENFVEGKDRFCAFSFLKLI